MDIEDIVCDVEYAEKLMSLGLGSYKSSLFFYDSSNNLLPWKNVTAPTFTNTYTVAELGMMLPSCIYKHGKHNGLIHEKQNESIMIFESRYFPSDLGMNGVEIWRHNYSDDSFLSIRRDIKEANARAKLLIYLIEKGYVKVEDLNRGQ